MRSARERVEKVRTRHCDAEKPHLWTSSFARRASTLDLPLPAQADTTRLRSGGNATTHCWNWSSMLSVAIAPP
eukprot:scaffold105969_cov34-Tisochrysis_lutea.AAC.2